MKKSKGVSLEAILARQLKDRELKILFDERRFYLQIAHLVADLRARTGMSQSALAKAAGVSQPLIARLRGDDPSGHNVLTFPSLWLPLVDRYGGGSVISILLANITHIVSDTSNLVIRFRSRRVDHAVNNLVEVAIAMV